MKQVLQGTGIPPAYGVPNVKQSSKIIRNFLGDLIGIFCIFGVLIGGLVMGHAVGF